MLLIYHVYWDSWRAWLTFNVGKKFTTEVSYLLHYNGNMKMIYYVQISCMLSLIDIRPLLGSWICSCLLLKSGSNDIAYMKF